MSTISKLVDKLRDKQYRKAFVASQINFGIPFQIRGLLKSRGWSQEKLASLTGMLQPRISAMLTPGKTRPNIETLRRIAEAFDCGVLVRFVPFSELVLWSQRFNSDKFYVPSFQEDVASGSFHLARASQMFSTEIKGMIHVDSASRGLTGLAVNPTEGRIGPRSDKNSTFSTGPELSMQSSNREKVNIYA